MDIFGIFKNHLMSRFHISSWSRAIKFLKTFLDSPRVGWNKNNRFETSKVFADMRHTSHMRQKWENQKMKIIKFSNLCLVSANTFDVSNRLFLFHPTLGLSKKVFRSFIALPYFNLIYRIVKSGDFWKFRKYPYFWLKIRKRGKKLDFFGPRLLFNFEAIHGSDILWR